LFYAEGNVSLYNKSLRWACKDERLIEIYSKFLKQLNLYDRYDGGCLISYNKKKFYEKIFPHLKHSKKINITKPLCIGEGTLPGSHSKVLNYLNSHPEKSAKDISKGLKKSKVYSELQMLSKLNYIIKESYPVKHSITSKGMKLLGEIKS
jgi:hypothetical protein